MRVEPSQPSWLTTEFKPVSSPSNPSQNILPPSPWKQQDDAHHLCLCTNRDQLGCSQGQLLQQSSNCLRRNSKDWPHHYCRRSEHPRWIWTTWLGGYLGAFWPWRDQRQRISSFVLCCDQQYGHREYFQHLIKHQFTWRNPSGKDLAMLDYVLINARFRSSLQDVSPIRGPDCISDHYLVHAQLRLKLQRVKRTPSRLPQLNWKQLPDDGCHQEF